MRPSRRCDELCADCAACVETAEIGADASSGYAFKLVEMDGLVNEDAMPSAYCYHPVTLPSLLELGYTHYSWVPWSYLDAATLEDAPHGAYIYHVADDAEPEQRPDEGEHVVLKIELTTVDDPDAALVFGPAQEIDTPYASFDELLLSADRHPQVQAVAEAALCTRSPLSYTTTDPFVYYDEFAWAPDPYALFEAGNTACGAFIYQKKGGGLVYHAC